MTASIEYTRVESPVGPLVVAWRGEAIASIRFHGTPERDWRRVDDADNRVIRQLRAYFAGDLRVFDLDVDQTGTPFQRRVWDAVARIPFGGTRSYGEVAREIGKPRAMRAVGAANGRNDVPIVVPCHRVVAADGSLHGYAGGLHIKAALLTFERSGVWDPAAEQQSML